MLSAVASSPPATFIPGSADVPVRFVAASFSFASSSAAYALAAPDNAPKTPPVTPPPTAEPAIVLPVEDAVAEPNKPPTRFLSISD